jgi:NAD(P)H dehydrogenase (quinone)
MIVVTAATGELGRRVVDHLLDRVPASDVAVAVRNPAAAGGLAARGVDVRHADYDDPATVAKAFAGADRVLLISSPELDPAKRIPQHLLAVEAARDAGVGGLVYTGALGADVSGEGILEAHHATERALAESGLTYTVLRNAFYSELFLNPGLQAVVDAGELTSSTQGRGLNTANRDDLAEATAVALAGEGHLGRSYDLTGPLWTYPELAAALGVAYREVEPAEGPFAWLDGLVRAGVLEQQTGDLAALLGRPGTSLASAVRAAVGR